ncbi:hypothetical protein [Enterococcus faecalis]|uniref:hypothetical protein n=1 Tax=Enterococcus faecalis TaxID=1351 RepID=UPI001E50D11D|nr:hypothetical protein [Enterococcus faecalis]MCD4978448.1 hypothetical protein [Enterococcus faecalis]
MRKKIGMALLLGMVLFFGVACKKNVGDYEDVINLVYEDSQKYNKDSEYKHGGREESNTYVYTLKGYEDEGLIIRIYYPSTEKKTDEKNYFDDWYIYEKATEKLGSGDIDENRRDDLTLKYKEINVDVDKEK